MVYYIERVANLTEEEGQHEKQFYKLLLPIVQNQHESASFFYKEKYGRILHVCKSLKADVPLKQLRKEGYFQVYIWSEKFDVFLFGSSEVVVCKDPSVDPTLLRRPSYYERVFSDLYAIHKNGHLKGNTFYKKVAQTYSNVSERIRKLFTDTCPRCVETMRKTKPTAGVKNIITEGFGVRGQVDLVDFQSMLDGNFKFLLNYIDHGIKKLTIVPLVAKRASTVALALLRIFTEQRPPCILQSDNDREFYARAKDSADRRLELEEEFIVDVFKEIKHLWPDVIMVKGLPRHSESQGDVERVNQTVQKRLATWMKGNNLTNWSLGCIFVQWQINASFHNGIKAVP